MRLLYAPSVARTRERQRPKSREQKAQLAYAHPFSSFSLRNFYDTYIITQSKDVCVIILYFQTFYLLYIFFEPNWNFSPIEMRDIVTFHSIMKSTK